MTPSPYKSTFSFIATTAAAVLLMAPSIAFAHAGHDAGSGFGHGVTHPVSGLDHILAMVTVGIWAAQVGGRAKWAVPLAFVGSMVIGGALQWAAVHVPQVETLIAVSVLALGLLVATAAKLPTWAAMMVVGLFAISHGAAHAAESAGSSPVAYAAGFVLATIALHAAGVGLGFAATGMKSPLLPRLAGGAIAVCGVLIVTGVL